MPRATFSQVKVDIKQGIHISPSKSPTVQQAGWDWVRHAETRGLERTTTKAYSEQLKLHIIPFIGGLKLSDVSVAVVRAFEDKLRQSGRSVAMTKIILGSLGAILADAQERGLSARNAVRDLRRGRGKRGDRDKRNLKVGVDIPAPAEVSAIIAAATGRWRPLFIVAAFTGLRASELRGLTWKDVDLKANELHVTQRADLFNKIGAPKSARSQRTVPFGPFVSNILKEWKLACPPGDLVFPTKKGSIEGLSNIIQRGLIPTVSAAGLVMDGKAKYHGMHVFRHFHASWCIDRGLPPKVIQERLGHSSITLTFDRYGHLFPRADDSQELEQAELAVVSATYPRHTG